MASTATNTGTTGTQKQQIDRLSETAHDYVDRAAQTATSVAERFGEKGEELLAMKEDWVEGAREYVKTNPLAAIGIAVAAGYLLAKIVSWR